MKRTLAWLLFIGYAIGVPGWLALALALGMAGLWWGVSMPLRDEAARLQAAATQLRQALAERRVAEVPADRGPRQQLEDFRARFPHEQDIAAQLTRLHALARRSGVLIERAEFRLVSDPNEALGRYTIELPVKADYDTLRRFSREALKALPALALEEVALRRADAGQPLLEAQLRLVLYLARTPSSP